MAKAKKRKKISIRTIKEGDPNPQNPCAQLSPEERMNHLKELCQSIYLRMSENSGIGKRKNRR